MVTLKANCVPYYLVLFPDFLGLVPYYLGLLLHVRKVPLHLGQFLVTKPLGDRF